MQFTTIQDGPLETEARSAVRSVIDAALAYQPKAKGPRRKAKAKPTASAPKPSALLHHPAARPRPLARVSDGMLAFLAGQAGLKQPVDAIRSTFEAYLAIHPCADWRKAWPEYVATRGFGAEPPAPLRKEAPMQPVRVKPGNEGAALTNEEPQRAPSAQQAGRDVSPKRPSNVIPLPVQPAVKPQPQPQARAWRRAW